MKKRYLSLFCLLLGQFFSYSNTVTVLQGYGTPIGHPSEPGTIYHWTPTEGLSDPNIANPIASPLSTTTYTCKSTSLNGEFNCNEATEFTVNVLEGISVELSDDFVCDGDPDVLVNVYPVPATLERSTLNVLEKFQVNVSYIGTWFGNPAQKATLTISDLSTTYTGKIENAYWYANQADLCNEDAGWDIRVQAEYKQNGDYVVVFDETILIVQVNKKCFPSEAVLTPNFSGKPNYSVIQDPVIPSKFIAVLTIGTYKVDYETEIVGLDQIHESSQYYLQAKAEEEYHVWQFSNSDYFKDLFTAEGFITFFNNKQLTFTATSFEEAQDKMDLLVIDQYPLYIADQEKKSDNRRCCIEYEAKIAVNSTYFTTLQCSYSDICPVVPPREVQDCGY